MHTGEQGADSTQHQSSVGCDRRPGERETPTGPRTTSAPDCRETQDTGLMLMMGCVVQDVIVMTTRADGLM